MKFRVVVDGHRYEVAVDGDRSLRVTLEGHTHAVDLFPRLGTTHFRALIDGTSYHVVIRRQDDVVLVGIGEDQYRLQVARTLAVARRTSGQSEGSSRCDIKAPMPGLIVAVEAVPGDRIEQGRPVVIMEAMKMQMEIRAPQRGRVVAVNVQPGQEVTGGAVLASLLESPEEGPATGNPGTGGREGAGPR